MFSNVAQQLKLNPYTCISVFNSFFSFSVFLNPFLSLSCHCFFLSFILLYSLSIFPFLFSSHPCYPSPPQFIIHDFTFMNLFVDIRIYEARIPYELVTECRLSTLNGLGLPKKENLSYFLSRAPRL